MIAEEYRADFGRLYRREYDMITAPVFREYIGEYENGCLWLDRWGEYFCNGDFPGINETSYDEESGFFSYGVTFNMHNTDLYYAITEFIQLLHKITERETDYRTWDEFDPPDNRQ